MNSLDRSALLSQCRVGSIPWHLLAIIWLLFAVGCTKEGPTGPQGPPSGDDLTNPAVMPRVIFSLPANNSTGPFDLFTFSGYPNKPHFVLRFNKLIDLNSFTPRSFRVQGFPRPASAVVFREYNYWIRDPHTIDSYFDDIIPFTIVDSANGYSRLPYEVGGTYSIALDTPLVDINGNSLAEPFVFSSTPEPFFRLTSAFPQFGETNVMPGTLLSFSFNGQPDTSIASAINIVPAPPAGRWRLSAYDSTTLIYQMWDPLEFNTEYTMTVSTSAHDVYGHHLQSPSTWTIRTAPFKVTTVSPANGTSNVNLGAPIYVFFSGWLDTGTVRQSVTVSPPTNTFLYINSERITLIAADQLTPATTYTVSISTGIKSVTGLNLSLPYVFSFTTEPFRMTYSNPSDGSTNVDRGSSLRLTFNSHLDSGTVAPAFSINPPAAGSLYLGPYIGEFSFVPSNSLEALTIYTATVGTSLRSKSGAQLQSPVIVQFRTGQ